MKSHRNLFSTVINTAIITTAVLLTFSLVAVGQTSTRQPIEETAVMTMARGDYAEDLPITFSSTGRGSIIPSGKRLVIEHVSARASLLGSKSATSNQKMVLSVLATFGGEQIEHFFVLTEIAVLPFHPNDPKDKRFSYAISQCSQATKIYADPGTQVIIRVLLDSAATDAHGKSNEKNEVLRLTVSGYWEDAATKTKPTE